MVVYCSRAVKSDVKCAQGLGRETLPFPDPARAIFPFLVLYESLAQARLWAPH